VGFHEYFLQSKTEGNDEEEKSDEKNEQSCEDEEKRRGQSECKIPLAIVLNCEANTRLVANPV
jgi:hypothetical protein